MDSKPTAEGHLPSLNDIISKENEVEPVNIVSSEGNQQEITNKEGNIIIPTQTQTTTKINQGPTVVKINRKIVTTTSQPVTETHVTKKIISTTTRGGEPKNVVNTRYNNTSNTGSSYNPKITQTKTVTSSNATNNNYTKPQIKSTVTYNRNPNTSGTNNVINSNVNNRNVKINNNTNQVYRNVNPNNQPSRIQNSQSYSGNRNIPQRPQVSSSNYKPKAVSPSPGSIRRKTINRGKPIENVQITHIIYSSRPLEFHITEDLNLENLETDPIQISEQERNNLQKSGKVEVHCSVDESKIKKPQELNLEGKLLHYQHAQGIGMTNDKNPKINKKYYFSEIKKLDPIIFNKGEPTTEALTFRSDGKKTTVSKTVIKTQVKPSTNYNSNKTASTYSQSRTYNNTNNYQPKTNTGVNNRGTGIKTTTTTTTSNYRGSSGTGKSGQIVKETTTKVQMGNRSQFQNQNQPSVKTTTERKVINQNNFFKK